MTGKRVSLALKSDYFNILEQWQISHVLDEHSPLWHLRDDLRNKLTGIEVSLVTSHLACSDDEGHPRNALQLARFSGIWERLRPRFPGAATEQKDAAPPVL